MKVLVTGASGLLGTELCRQLKLNDDIEVWAIDNHSRSDHIPECDVWLNKDISCIADLPSDFEYIFHFAAINGTSNFYSRPNEVLSNNITRDLLVFSFAATCSNLKRIVYASSSEVVSDDPDHPVSETLDIKINHIHNPRWSYRIAKIASENYLANSSLPWLICRYFNVYSENSKRGHFTADLIEKISNGVFELIGADETRSFCYVTDSIEATLFCSRTVVQEVVNIGNDTELTIIDAANIIAKELGHENIDWKILPNLPGSTMIRKPDLSKLRTIMPNFSPISFEEGMSKIIAKLR